MQIESTYRRGESVVFAFVSTDSVVFLTKGCLLHSPVRDSGEQLIAHIRHASHKSSRFSHLHRLLVKLSTAMRTDSVDNLMTVPGGWHRQCSPASVQKRYILFISFVNQEMIVSEPGIRKPTKKAFHFPKHANGHAKADDKQASEKNSLETEAKGVKPASETVAKRKRAVAPEVAVSPPAETKPKRAKKEKVVRDSFTMPTSDYEKIAALKQKCLDAGVAVKKSELLRAGLLMLESAAPKRLLAAVSAVETVKTGRPTK
ncbi:hypothetical protein P3T16_006327 [Paraburkholderia sp. GAS42]